MNLSGIISMTKSNKTNKNIFTVTKILISFDFFFQYFPKIIQATGKIKLI